jgi:hypothetical protein
VVAPGQPEQVASSLEQLAAAPAQLEAMAQAGRAYAAQFAEEGVLSQFEQLILQITAVGSKAHDCAPPVPGARRVSEGLGP